MLQHLADENNIRRRQRIFAEIKHSKVDIELLNFSQLKSISGGTISHAM